LFIESAPRQGAVEYVGIVADKADVVHRMGSRRGWPEQVRP
jgi:hypothetical protein